MVRGGLDCVPIKFTHHVQTKESANRSSKSSGVPTCAAEVHGHRVAVVEGLALGQRGGGARQRLPSDDDVVPVGEEGVGE